MRKYNQHWVLSKIGPFKTNARTNLGSEPGVLDPRGGVLRPDLTRPGLGLALKDVDAERFRVA